MNTTLPIHAYREAILASVVDHPVTIIVAETGAGKSTQVPQYLLEQGLRVLVTQPRRLACSTVAERVAQEWGCQLGGTVGYRTARDRQDGPETACLFATEGLALIREIMGARRAYDVLVLDEVHEWSRDMEVLVGWARRELQRGGGFRLVLMSATLEAERLSAHFNGAPIISVPGRTFPVETRPHTQHLDYARSEPWGAMAADIRALVADGKNVLAFCPGKNEITTLCQVIADLDAEVLPLHGGLDRSEQARCFRRYPRPKVIVATNIAQTSITIDDIDAVVDSGLERRTEVHHGVEGLYLRPISRADSAQRKGRAGRTRVGVYIDHASEAVRDDFPTAEILRIRLDQAVLRLAMAGVDLEELELFHQPERSEIHKAKETLRALGCMSDGTTVTEMGARVSRLPCSVRSGRMLVEAERLGVVEQVTTIAAIIESGGIVDTRVVDEKHQPVWRRLVTDTASDHVAMLRIYEAAERMGEQRWRSAGIFAKGMTEARAMRHELSHAVTRVLDASLPRGDRDAIVKAVAVGLIDQLRQRGTNKWGEIVYGGDARRLAKESALDASSHKWVVAEPFDIQGQKGPARLLRLTSAVKLAWLSEIAPSMVTVETGSATYDPEKDCVTAQQTVRFAGQAMSTERVEVAEPTALPRWLARITEEGYTIPADVPEPHRARLGAIAAARKAITWANDRCGEERYVALSTEKLLPLFAEHTAGACRLADVDLTTLEIPGPSEAELARLRIDYPDAIRVGGKDVRVRYGCDVAVVRLEKVSATELPDYLRTPGGRALSIEIAVGGYYQAFENGTAARLALREQDIETQWRSWVQPAIEEGTVGVLKHAYGIDPVSRDPLFAYGTLSVHGAIWRNTREAAEQAWATARLSTLRERARTLYYSEEVRGLSVKDDLFGLLYGENVAELEQVIAAAELAIEAEKIRQAEEAALDVVDMNAARPVVTEVRYGTEPDDGFLRDVVRFVRAAVVMMGASSAATLLRVEADAAYGRACRTGAIHEAFPGLGGGFDWAAGRDIVAIAAWAEHVAKRAAPSNRVPRGTKPAAQPTAAPTMAAKPAGAEAVVVSMAALRDRFGGGKKRAAGR